MNARSYRVNLSLLPSNFPEIVWMGDSSIAYQSEPFIHKNNVILTITMRCVFTDMNTKKGHDVLSVKSDYEIPTHVIRNREDVYEFYKDATLGLNETYQHARTQVPALPNIPFPNPPIENYKPEIDRVFDLLHRQN